MVPDRDVITMAMDAGHPKVEALEAVALQPGGDSQTLLAYAALAAGDKARALASTDAAIALLVVAALGNGARVTAQDTVPFALWSASWNLGDFDPAFSAVKSSPDFALPW